MQTRPVGWRARRAGLGETRSWIGLVPRCLDEDWSEAALEAASRSPIARILLASKGAAEPVAFVVARRISDLLEIDLVGVLPGWRRRGLASMLLETLVETEAETGATEARLELRASNARARALYAGLGFVVVGQRARYYPDGEDALLLTRRLSPGSSTEG